MHFDREYALFAHAKQAHSRAFAVGRVKAQIIGQNFHIIGFDICREITGKCTRTADNSVGGCGNF